MVIAISEKANLSNFRSNVGTFDQDTKELTLWYSTTHIDPQGFFKINEFDMPKGVKGIKVVDNDFDYAFHLTPKELKIFYKDKAYMLPINKCLAKYAKTHIDEASFGTTVTSSKRI